MKCKNNCGRGCIPYVEFCSDECWQQFEMGQNVNAARLHHSLSMLWIMIGGIAVAACVIYFGVRLGLLK